MAAIELSEAAATITGILVKPPGGVPGISPLGIPPPPGISPLGIVPPPGKVPPPPIPPICIGSVAKMYLSVLYAEPYVVPNAAIASATADDDVS